MAKQTVGIGSSANDGNGDTLRTGATKINDNFNEIYAEFGNGTNLSSGNTAGDILVADGTKFANVTTSGDVNISNTGAINLRGNSLTIAAGSTPSPTTRKLYNVGDTLYWNGTAVGVAGGSAISGFNVSGDSGSDAVADGNTINFTGGTGLTTAAADNSGTPTVTLNIDATVATLTGTQTFTNKSLTAPTLTGSSSAAGSILFREDTDNGTNAVTLIGPAATADVTVTLPAATGTIALTSDITVSASSTNTFTNKTFDADATGNNLTNVEDANIKTGANIAQAKLNLAITTAEVAAATLVVASEGIGSNNNDTTIPTSAAVKAYADSVGGGNSFTTIAVSGQTDVVADSGSDTLTLAAGSNVTLTTNAGSDTVTIAASGGGASNLNGLSDATISSAAAGNILLHDGSDSFDNKVVKSNNLTLAHTSALAIPMGGFTFGPISANGTSAYRYGDYKSDGDHQDNPHLYLLSDMAYIFDLSGLGGSHPFQIQASTSALTASNGADGLIHISTTGVVTTGTSANTKTSGLLIWKVPHFTAASTGTYRYICTSHSSMVGSITIKTLETIT